MLCPSFIYSSVERRLLVLLARALVVAGTHPRPFAEVRRSGENRHVQPYLGDNLLAGAGAYTWNLAEAFHNLAKRSQYRTDTVIKLRYSFLKLVITLPDALQHVPLVVGHVARARFQHLFRSVMAPTVAYAPLCPAGSAPGRRRASL